MTKITKTMRAGYQSRKDSMREKADKLMNHPGKSVDVHYSKSCAEKDKPRLFKKGGCAEDMPKFAMGGVAKIRHEEATPKGLPRTFKKKSLKDIL